MKISNDFKKLWLDKKGVIKEHLEVEVLDVSNGIVSLGLRLTDEEEAKLMEWGPYVLKKGNLISLTGIKVLVDV